MKDLAAELTGLEKDVAFTFGNVLHPAGGLTENFVYEPLGTREYVYCTKDGEKGIVPLQIEYEDSEKKKRPSWKIAISGKPYYFSKKPPKEWLFNIPNREFIEKWVNGKKKSLSAEKLWQLNSVYLRTFLDFPHEYEFSASLLFIQQTWLTEIVPVVFYLGVKGEFGGGKTVTGETITAITRHGYLTGNVSPPFVARAIQEQKITLMVDELDSLAGTKDSDLNSIYRQGYRRGLKYSRVNPDSLESESYYIFGPKIFTVHTDIEEALQTRTIPIHVRETDKPEFPIVNLGRDALSRSVHLENFLWYLDNILLFRDNDMHILNGLTEASVDMVDLILRGDQVDGMLKEKASNIRNMMYEKKRVPLKKGQLSQLCQLAGRNVELMYMCFMLSNIIKVDCEDDIVKTFQQKLVEEGERSEIGFLGLLRDTLIELWKQKQGKTEYTTEDGFVKISNKEIYNTFNSKLKKEFDAGVSPATFKGYMLVFGFTDALNRTKLKVPIPGEEKAQSRLCNIFTARVIRKLGPEPQEKTKLEQLEEIKKWILENKKDGVISASALNGKIKEYGFDPQEIVQKLKAEGLLFEVTELNAFGVV